LKGDDVADRDSVTIEIQVAAPTERVFAAISDPQQVSQWWGQGGLYRVTGWRGDLRVGGKWRSDGVGADGKPFHVEGEYLEVDPPVLLVHTWVPSYAEGVTTTVRWELKTQDGGTHVTVHHSGFAGHADLAQSHSQGWVRVLGWMRGFVEKGETVDSRG
jgi:uncharacterized protein YndB with AHSA1/START domain